MHDISPLTPGQAEELARQVARSARRSLGAPVAAVLLDELDAERELRAALQARVDTLTQERARLRAQLDQLGSAVLEAARTSPVFGMSEHARQAVNALGGAA